tara:strand:- start:125 stop:973 length:849 start_codon:yes stop_codon:yes gene_type:complete
MLKDFAALILTHGRPSKVKTYHTLKNCGYTGRIVIVVDDEDDTVEDYKDAYGEEVYVFSKEAIAKTFDEADNFNDRRAIVYARNASFEIAKELGVKNFIQLDDDYTTFAYKFNGDYEYGDWKIKNLDSVFNAMLKFYNSTNITSIAMAQGGDFIGGKNSGFAKKIKPKRKCMNTFICSTDRPFKFVGRINEDVNTYTSIQGRGGVFLTIPNIAITQLQTQSNSGGMTDIYLDGGTFIKTFYSIIFSPSCVKVALMGTTHKRLHHRVSWNNAVPVIMSEYYKK